MRINLYRLPNGDWLAVDAWDHERRATGHTEAEAVRKLEGKHTWSKFFTQDAPSSP